MDAGIIQEAGELLVCVSARETGDLGVTKSSRPQDDAGRGPEVIENKFREASTLDAQQATLFKRALSFPSDAPSHRDMKSGGERGGSDMQFSLITGSTPTLGPGCVSCPLEKRGSLTISMKHKG